VRDVGEPVPTLIDLFAGCGGASLGFRQAGFHILAAIEIDTFAARAYARNHPGTLLLTQDIRRVSPEGLSWRLGRNPGDCTAVIGCPPCQGFSSHRIKGAGRGDPRNTLVGDFAAFVCAMRPEFFVFENVLGVRNHPEGLWKHARCALEVAGYRITEDVLDAVDFGVPQRRKRVVAIGCRLDGVVPRLPTPTHGAPGNRRNLPPWRTVRDAIRDLTPLRSGTASRSDNLHFASKHTTDVLRKLEAIPKDGGSRRQLPKEFQLQCHQGYRGHQDVYGRLWWDKPSGTITGGCYTPSKGRFVHPSQNRGITLREATRLQAFPDDFHFSGFVHHIAEQIGNALPPPLARAIATEVKKVWSEASTVPPDDAAVWL
jgi:DNA (cytosine-5)-methyltransferase 1